jgi:hypothetical protein
VFELSLAPLAGEPPARRARLQELDGICARWEKRTLCLRGEHLADGQRTARAAQRVKR